MDIVTFYSNVRTAHAAVNLHEENVVCWDKTGQGWYISNQVCSDVTFYAKHPLAADEHLHLWDVPPQPEFTPCRPDEAGIEQLSNEYGAADMLRAYPADVCGIGSIDDKKYFQFADGVIAEVIPFVETEF